MTYTEDYVKARVRRGVIRTGIISFLLVFLMAMVLVIHSRSRTPGGPIFEAVDQDFAATGTNIGDEGRNLQRCFEYTQLVADRSLYGAALTCAETIIGVGCSTRDIIWVNYYQIVYGGNWYVFCRCDC